MVLQPIAMTTSLQQFAGSRMQPFIRVFSWEVRRLLASRGAWVTTAGTMIVFAGLLALSNLVQGEYVIATPRGTYTFALPTTSVYGLLISYVQNPGMFFALMLPFTAADAVNRDLRGRSHELVMATPVPSRAYVWGRYSAALLYCLVLASAILIAVLSVAAIFQFADSSTYPAVAIPKLVAAWALVVVPPVFLLSGISFALGTLLPRRPGLAKVAVMLSWFAAGGSLWYLLNPHYRDTNPPPAPYAVWDPTSIAPSFSLSRELKVAAMAHAQSLDSHAFHAYIEQLMQTMPDVWSWVVPHLFWCAIGLLAVVLAASAFRRFASEQSQR